MRGLRVIIPFFSFLSFPALESGGAALIPFSIPMGALTWKNPLPKIPFFAGKITFSALFSFSELPVLYLLGFFLSISSCRVLLDSQDELESRE